MGIKYHFEVKDHKLDERFQRLPSIFDRNHFLGREQRLFKFCNFGRQVCFHSTTISALTRWMIPSESRYSHDA